MSYYPTTDERGDYLIYHRLTGMGSSDADGVVALAEGGLVLAPYHERDAARDGAEMFGIDPIDLAAGDGGAIFCSPLGPVNPGMWAKAGFYSTPGVAFRLSDLLSCCECSVRPVDFQTFYMQIIDRSALHEAYGALLQQVGDHYDLAGFLDPLSQAFEIVRTAERWDAFEVLDRAIRRGRLEHDAGHNAPFRQAAESAAELYAEVMEPDLYEEDNESELQTVTDSIEAAISEAYYDAHGAWEDAKPEKLEVLVWTTGLPLSMAYLAFDQEGTVKL